MKRFSVFSVAVLIMMALMFFTTGCASLEKPGYSGKLEVIQAQAQPVQTGQPCDNSQVIDAINNLGRNLLTAVKNGNGAAASAQGRKMPSGVFSPTNARAVNKPAKPVAPASKTGGMAYASAADVRHLQKAVKEHGKRILQLEAGKKIDIVGFFKPGNAELECSVKGCSLRQQIEDLVVEGTQEGRKITKIVGYTDTSKYRGDKYKGNEDLGLARAKAVKSHLMKFREEYKDVPTEFGGEVFFFGSRQWERVVVVEWN